MSETGWIPHAFAGNLEGDGLSVTNCTIAEVADYMGLFTYLRGTVRNIEFSGFNIKGNRYIGAIAGAIEKIDGIAIENCKVVNSTIESTNATSYVGSMAGGFVSGHVKNSYSEASVIGGNHSGGLFGRITSGEAIDTPIIENSYFAGDIVSTGTSLGGLVGSVNQSPTVVNSYFLAGSGEDNQIGEIKTQEEMLLASTYVGWEEPMANHLQKVWTLADGLMPSLYFESDSRFLVAVGSTYYRLDGQDWVEMGDVLPTEAEFAAYGLSEGSLSGVPGFVWNKLRIHQTVELVNMRERFKINQLYDHIVLENQGQTVDGFLLKATIDLDNYTNGLNRLYFK